MKQRQVGTIAIITPRGYLTDGDELDELEKEIKSLSEEGNKNLVINLCEVGHINGTGLGVLISAHSNYVRRGGSIAICGVDKRIENIFVISKLSLVFNVYPNEEQAIASFAERESVRKGATHEA